MSHQIYYTSAPEGVKPGSHGFCTVGVTDGIPRALWERLETLSAFRHESTASPVVHAHWLLHLAGKEYHVLSRICDSGTDYTHRTNCFAHHLALESSELPPGGPAALLQQPGLMAERWDGRVGTIPNGTRASGPHGEGGETDPQICHAWQAATGDPGFAGVLADAFLKSPAKPVGLLYRPGQQMLPLLAEAIALLPAHLRWNVTFSTYFTSMPPGAVCNWRCCLANTPAAALVLRQVSGAGGTILNLADPTQLRKIADSPLVQLARTGISPAKPAPEPPPPPAPEPPPAAPPPAETRTPVVVDVADLAAAPLAADVTRPSRPHGWAESPLSASPAVPDEDPAARVSINRAAAHRGAPPRVAAGMIQVPAPSTSAPARPILAYAVPPASRPIWPWVLMAVLLLVILLLAGVFVLLFHRSAAPSPPPPAVLSPTPVTPPVTPPVTTGPVVVTPPPPTQATQPFTPPVTTGSAVITPPPTQPIQIIPPTGPRITTLPQTLDIPPTGTVMRAQVQTIPLPAAALKDLGGVSLLTLAFPEDKPDYRYEQGDIAGTFFLTPGPNAADRAACSLKWKDSGAPVPLEVLKLEIDGRRGQLTVTWPIRAALERPDLARLAWWLLPQSAVVVSNFGRTKSERLVLKAPELPPLKLADAETALKFPCELPPLVVAQNAGPLPLGWQAAGFLDWPGQDHSQRTAENVSRVVAYKKPNAIPGLEPAAFELTFKPAFAAVTSNYSQRVTNDQTDLNRYLAELKQTDLTPARRAEYERFVQGYRASQASYQEITTLEIHLLLPNHQKIATLRLTRDPPHNQLTN